MLNKKAHKAAAEAAWEITSAIAYDRPYWWAVVGAAIEAYRAALPDAGGLVGFMRSEARQPKCACSEPHAAGLLRDGADALEAAQAQSGAPKGWRLVPEKATDEWSRTLAAKTGTSNTLAIGSICRVLAAAPEISDD